MIPFNRPPYTGNEDQHVLAAMRSAKISGDGDYSRRCQEWFEKRLGCAKALLTPSCTQALEMAALLLDIRPGDEVIMPSYTFVSTANAFVLRGATVVFVDIDPVTMNIDAALIEAAVTPRTRCIVVVHYAGVGCDMEAILGIASRHDLAVVEDAAQAVSAFYRGRPLGTFGQLAAFSFHETKNLTSGGEGGLLVVNDPRYVQRAEILREKGTNRSQFFRGMVDKYSWVDLGSSYLPSELQAAYLWGQLERESDIMADRLRVWNGYASGLRPLAEAGLLGLPVVPALCGHNGHLFHLKLGGLDQRTRFIEHLKSQGVHAVFHYVPLHSALAGKRFSRFHGVDRHTTVESEKLVRLPLWYGLDDAALASVVAAVGSYFPQT